MFNNYDPLSIMIPNKLDIENKKVKELKKYVN